MSCNCKPECVKCEWNGKPIGGPSMPESCANRYRLHWIPNTLATLGLTVNGITSQLDLCPGIKNCESNTRLYIDPATCELVYEGETFTSSDGMQGSADRILISKLVNCLQLADIGNVHCTDPDNGSLLVYRKDLTCGENCKSPDDGWYCYQIPPVLTPPTDPSGQPTINCTVEPDDDGNVAIVTRDPDTGLLKECYLQNPTDEAYDFWVRDSWPDNYDWPFYYGNYDEIVDFHLDRNVPSIFGKFDLEVTLEYVFTTERPTVGFDASVKSVALPFFDDDLTIDNGLLPANYDAWKAGAIHIELVNLMPWGTRSAQVSRTLLVPKGKNLKLFHMVRMRGVHTNGFFPNPTPTQWDGQQMTSLAIDQALTNFSRMFANRVVVRPVNLKFQGQAPVWDTAPTSLRANTNDPFVIDTINTSSSDDTEDSND